MRPPRPEPVYEGPDRAGFALLLGRPNAGKSTLLNRLVGEHLAAVSPKPQTTRHRIVGVVNRPHTQLCLVDTPGVHKAKGLLHRTMVDAAIGALDDVDLVLYLAEAGWPREKSPGEVDPVGPSHRELLAQVARSGKPAALVLTKIDLVPKPLLLPLLDAWSKAFDFKTIYPLSALTGENVEGFIHAVRAHLPESEPLFSPDVVTDQTERALCGELIREQVFLQTREEIPYGAAVTIEEFDESGRPQPVDVEETVLLAALATEDESVAAEGLEAADEGDFDTLEENLGVGGAADEELESDGYTDELVEAPGTGMGGDVEAEPLPDDAALALGPGLVRIHASIILERDSHKGIVIGKGGERLRAIGSASRLRIERLLGCRIWLELHVRVIPGWTEKRAMLAEIGIDV